MVGVSPTQTAPGAPPVMGRRGRRRDLRGSIAVLLQPMREARRSAEGRVLNVSIDGMACLANAAASSDIVQHEDLIARFRLNDRGATEFELHARVVYRAEAAAAGCVRIGLQFTYPAGREQDRISLSKALRDCGAGQTTPNEK